MSRLGDTLRKVLHVAPPALGFRPTASAKPRMVLVAAISEVTADTCAWAREADAVVLGITPKPREIKSLAKNISAPWGIWLSDTTSHAADAAGADFVVFEPDKTGIDLVLNNGSGKIMAVDTSLDNAVLHGVSELPIEAIYLKRTPHNALTWLELMQCRRLSGLIAKPLLVPVAPDILPAQIMTLWEAGVDGVVVAATAKDRLRNMRREMDELGLPARRKWLRTHPLVPAISPTPPHAGHEEDDEEDE